MMPLPRGQARSHRLRSLALAVCVCVAASIDARAAQSDADPPCGELVTVPTHGSTTTKYALARPQEGAPAHAVVLLLAGQGGHLDLDARGCARALTGNFLVRSQALLHAHGLITALADAPSDHPGEDGLAGFRGTVEHADDLGKLIADLRARTQLPVWVVGTSRGTISAANAAARLAGVAAPDGVVLTSVLTVGSASKPRPWLSHTVFDARLEAVRAPTLIVGHADDACLRSPPAEMARVLARIGAARKQAVTVPGGAGRAGAPSIEDCLGRSPHGFLGQEAEVIGGIARFIRGQAY